MMVWSCLPSACRSYARTQGRPTAGRGCFTDPGNHKNPPDIRPHCISLWRCEPFCQSRAFCRAPFHSPPPTLFLTDVFRSNQQLLFQSGHFKDFKVELCLSTEFNSSAVLPGCLKLPLLLLFMILSFRFCLSEDEHFNQQFYNQIRSLVLLI